MESGATPSSRSALVEVRWISPAYSQMVGGAGGQKESRRYRKPAFNRFLRFDELLPLSIILQLMSKDEVLEVQRLYPQIYIACHTDHIRAVSTAWRISSQDASILGASTAKRA
jgi:hypothetical protein